MWRFSLGDRAMILESGEHGEVIGRAEFQQAERSYLLRYKGGDGKATEAWWTESALV